MAFVKKVWKDRIAEYINRRLLTKEDGTQELVTVARNEGNISQEGDAFNAANMNDLEERIANEFQVLNEGSGCAYKGIQVIYKRNVDIGEGLYTSAWDGFVQGIAKTAANSGNPFIRLEINGSVIFEGNGVNKNYSYLWSPLFEVRKGDIIKYTLTSDTDDSNKELRIYMHRAR